MKEMKININMDDKKNVTMTNESTNKELVIYYDTKKINASDLYDLLSYSECVKYIISDNCDSISEGDEKKYFNEIINILCSIKDELNTLNKDSDKDDSDNEDSNNTHDELLEVI